MIKEDAKKYDSIQWRMKGAYVHWHWSQRYVCTTCPLIDH
jgi:hypothetical protein